MVDYIADYMENISQRRVLPEVQPGYMREMLPGTAPHKPERWEDIMKDVESAIMPGVSVIVIYKWSFDFNDLNSIKHRLSYIR